MLFHNFKIIFLFTLYLFAWCFFFPIIILYSLFKFQDRKALLKRFGLDMLLTQFNKNSVWIHACSVGEINSISPIVNELEAKRINTIISCITITGFNRIKDLFPHLRRFMLPFDILTGFYILISFNIPKSLIIVETEIWPAMLLACKIRGINIILVNARISDNSYPRYKALKKLISPFLNMIDIIYAQNNESLNRLKSLGYSRNIKLIPNMKFWSVSPSDKPDENLFPYSIDYLIAGSTHYNEEKIIFNIYKNLLIDFPQLRLIVAPRHINRISNIEKTATSMGLNTVRKSNMSSPSNIVLLDTIGELSKYYNLPGTVFIGGSFSNTGGHNPLEALANGKIPINGPDYKNFKDIISILKNNDLILIAENEEDLYIKIKRDLEIKNDNIHKINDFFKSINSYKSKFIKELILKMSNPCVNI